MAKKKTVPSLNVRIRKIDNGFLVARYKDEDFNEEEEFFAETKEEAIAIVELWLPDSIDF